MTKSHFIWDDDDVQGITVVNPAVESIDPIQDEIDRIDRLLGPDALIIDAAPSSLYVYRRLLNGAVLHAWAVEHNIPNPVPADELHVTILHSSRPVDWMELGAPWDETLEVPAGGPRVIEVFGENKIVLRFNSPSLLWRHNEMVREGASHDYATYAAHITIGEGELPDLGTSTTFTDRLSFGPEIFEEIK